MSFRVRVRKDAYFDSVLLMRISKALESRPGVESATVAMGTPHNHELLEALGFGGPELADAGPNDLLIAVRGDVSAEAVDAALAELLAPRKKAQGQTRAPSLNAALTAVPEANLVLISLPGEHAAREAKRALLANRHVMVFSDNVALADEVALKTLAVERGLLMMGPDCGTAIINGKPLAFANVVRRGPIGVVGASGTGIQEITCCVHRLGGGISQAIGTGGRDLSEAVGGRMTRLGLVGLANDPATSVLVVVSKPPAPAVAEALLADCRRVAKPCVVHFVGDKAHPDEPEAGLYFADTLAGAAERACELAGLAVTPAAPVNPATAQALAATLPAGATLRALFCGGTTGYEALVLLTRGGLEVASNLSKHPEQKLNGDEYLSGRHVLLDLGDDLFTQGRPHPMIEPVLRNERLASELAHDPSAALLLFDVVLGFGSHEDPAGLTASAVAKARALGRPIVAIASITGTPEDPQDYAAARRVLEAEGVVVMPDNRRAVELCLAVLKEGR